jgi:hypothetical protein
MTLLLLLALWSLFLLLLVVAADADASFVAPVVVCRHKKIHLIVRS